MSPNVLDQAERPINEMVVRLHRANADDPIAKLINPQQHLSTEGLTHPHEIRAFQAEINSPILMTLLVFSIRCTKARGNLL